MRVGGCSHLKVWGYAFRRQQLALALDNGCIRHPHWRWANTRLRSRASESVDTPAAWPGTNQPYERCDEEINRGRGALSADLTLYGPARHESAHATTLGGQSILGLSCRDGCHYSP